MRKPNYDTMARPQFNQMMLAGADSYSENPNPMNLYAMMPVMLENNKQKEFNRHVKEMTRGAVFSLIGAVGINVGLTSVMKSFLSKAGLFSRLMLRTSVVGLCFGAGALFYESNIRGAQKIFLDMDNKIKLASKTRQAEVLDPTGELFETFKKTMMPQ